MSRAPLLLAVASLGLLGCNYDETRAVRQYHADLEPARHLIKELTRHQTRISGRHSADKTRRFVDAEVLNRARRLLGTLEAIHPTHPEIRALHEDLTTLWTRYVDVFATYVADLDDHSLQAKTATAEGALEELSSDMHHWGTRLWRLHVRVSGWSG